MNAYQRLPKSIPRLIGHYWEWIEPLRRGPSLLGQWAVLTPTAACFVPAAPIACLAAFAIRLR